MDLGEKLFGVWSNWRRHRELEELRSFQYELSDCDKALALIVQPFFENPVEVHAAKESGVVGERFYLPSSIVFFRDRQRNRDLYIHQILMMAGAQKLNLRGREEACSAKRNRISDFINNHYPEFSFFQSELFREFSAASPRESESWLFWGRLSSEASFSTLPEKKLGTTDSRKSKNPPPSLDLGFEREEVDLDKEKQNPVTHSFEKMETADEYQGGSRPADGADELQEHSEALKELKLKKVTRSGESAASFLDSEIVATADRLVSSESCESALPEVYFYPEWHYKKNKFQENHCRLFLGEGMIGDEKEKWREKLKEKYHTLILSHQERLFQICNQRKWRGRQQEGEEIDIDAVVRHFSDLRHKIPSAGGLYQSQFLRERDFELLVLIDLSLSTDSYVDNRRVLDVELEAVGLLGLIMEGGLKDQTTVAGTFSETRHHCHFEVLKKAQEGWGAYFHRAPQVVPRGYTRLAPAIRHGTRVLSESAARGKVLLILTDGKPTDYDGYEGRYGIEDIHKACLEAESRNIFTKAIAIEKSAKYYFPQMFRSYDILSSPELLPRILLQTFLQAQKSFNK